MSDVAEVLVALEVEVLGESENRRSGALEYKARCPWHKKGTAYDHTPGWYINSETGEHICFSCGFSGTLQVLAYRLLDLGWDDAGAWVNNKTDIMARFSERDAWAKEDRGPRIQMAPINDARILAFEDPPEQELAKRGISLESAQAYEIRWDPRTAAWILPIRSPEGYLLGWQVKGTGPDRLFRNYPLGVQKGSTLFGMQTLSGTEEVGVIESPLDAARLHTLGYEATATFGATVTETQMELLIEHARALMVAMDNPRLDDAGFRSALWMLGLDTNGKPLRRGQDYSKRIRMRFFNYDDLDAKDPGEMKGKEIRTGWMNARGSIYGAGAVLR
jgi:DNA primase